MAGYFKKRRKNQGPNKNEEKVMRAEDARRASGTTLEQRHQFVKRLKISIQFFTPQQQLLDEKVLDLKPSDACRFDATCPGRCGTGRFDFSETIASVVQRRQPLAETSLVCRRPLMAGVNATCDCQAKCRIEAEYLPLPEPEDSAASKPAA